MADILMDQEQIKQVIPHRDPFLLIDEIGDMEVGVRFTQENISRRRTSGSRGTSPDIPLLPVSS